MTETLQSAMARVMRVVILPTLMLIFASGAGAVTIDEYKAKVDSAWRTAVEIERSLGDDQGGSSRLHQLAEQVRRDFPASERIEWQGGIVETSSTWLLESVAVLEKETNRKKQQDAIVGIREYLSAISFKLNELKIATANDGQKDQDKQKLAEILRREEYQKPQAKQESAIQRWLTKFFEWLESLFPKSNVPTSTFSGMAFLAMVLQVVLYAALIALLVFLIYKIVPLIFPKLRRDPKPKRKKERVILGEHLGEDATAVDLFAEAERLAREGNLRGAIRKGYIALLCDLSDRKVIGLAHNKTNRDYLRDVRARRDLHSRMRSVTDTFERHWYGFQESGDQDWARFRDEYKEAIRSV
jgi:hypothetical protein